MSDHGPDSADGSGDGHDERRLVPAEGAAGAADPAAAVLGAVAAVAPEVRASLSRHRGYVAETNESGDDVTEADVYADERLAEVVGAVGGVGEYVSEEQSAVVDVGPDPADPDAVAVAVDPLDGSSNLQSNNPTGTIVGVYDAPLPAGGADLVASAYVLFGPTTRMVAAREGRVQEYHVDDEGATLATDDLALPAEPTVYGFGGGRDAWPDAFRAYADSVAEELKLRYGGAFVADVTQVLTYGGVFAYPALTDAPRGKLRALFEALPVAQIVEAAGGRSSDGERSLLALDPDDIHERTPVYVGNAAYVDRLEDALD
ncbi:MAG: class 1 fructose-bisphosphatase [Halolamina sp.]